MSAEEPEITTVNPEAATLFFWQWLNLSVKSLALTPINNRTAGRHLASSHQTIYMSLLSGHKLLNLIFWHNQNNYLPVTKAWGLLLEA